MLPANGTAWPFIWAGNFAVSDTPLTAFDDSSQDGTRPTSARTQFARCTAAYLRGFQQRYGVQFYAVSVQNELNFEEFYYRATYPLSSRYIAALKRLRAELDKYPDLAGIKLEGPADLLGSDADTLWQCSRLRRGDPLQGRPQRGRLQRGGQANGQRGHRWMFADRVHPRQQPQRTLLCRGGVRRSGSRELVAGGHEHGRGGVRRVGWCECE